MSNPISNPNGARRPLWPLLGALWVLLLALASIRPLALPDEGRYGEVGRWMAQSGDWLIPRLNGLPFFHKPPYLYWLEATSVSLFGTHIWAVRLVPVLHAGMMLGLLYVMARRMAGEALARRAALVFACSLTFVVGGQYVNHDMVVASWISTAIWCFGWAFQSGDKPHAGWARAGYLACGLGLMTKGLIGLALPGLALLVWLVWTGQTRKILALPWISGLAIFFAVTVPWFVLVERAYPGSFGYLFGVQQYSRFVGTTFNNAQPWWFYLLMLLLLLLPWSLFALAQPLAVRQKPGHAHGLPPVWRKLCWITVVSITGFFSIPVSKLVGYILPVTPALALLAADGYTRLTGDKRWTDGLFATLAALAVTTGAGISWFSASYIAEKSTQDIAPTLACAWRDGDRLYASGAYPYDLPFYLQSREPMAVVMDWPALRRDAGDSWERELFEGADFDPAAARMLQEPAVLTEAVQQPGRWLVTRNEQPAPTGWVQVRQGTAWTLYRSALERPETAEHKGLPGCNHQGGAQRQP